jgi:hypothetical protein
MTPFGAFSFLSKAFIN